MTSSYIAYGITVFTALFAIMNPIANMPVFMSLVGDQDDKTQREIARKACITAFFIIAACVIGGNAIFKLFGLTIPAFKIAGGLLLFYIGFEMLQSKTNPTHTQPAPIDDGVAVSPLAIPMLAGPGTIVTAMSEVTHRSYVHVIILLVMFALLCFITYLTFISASRIKKFLGKNIILVIGKIMGLVISVIGVGMVIAGIKLAFNI
ncbi:MAG: MarC family protein [Alphaproteobacteria bacterium]